MKFKVDENLSVLVAQQLREEGLDAMTILEQKMGGEKDHNIARICAAEDRAIVTLDLDFANIRAYPPKEHAGIVVLRLKRHDVHTLTTAINRMVQYLKQEPLTQRLWIVSERQIRIHEG